MYQKKVAEDIRCPLEYGLKMFSGKWESRVLCVLNQKQSLRYSELRKELGDVTDAILADTLKKMMQNQLLERHSYDEIPPRVEYSLIKKGKSLIPLLKSICQWSLDYWRDSADDDYEICDYSRKIVGR
ncbi:winged helix-turn-helix transcriptional regulator [Lactobacillus sp.]|uniref:winged helix-turn-helix transcriptional regulator n=1 Tax=Lactobacillus sp. TaxID=1591 RepID=UPI003EF8DBE2